jgi:hypothetical protein
MLNESELYSASDQLLSTHAHFTIHLTQLSEKTHLTHSVLFHCVLLRLDIYRKPGEDISEINE